MDRSYKRAETVNVYANQSAKDAGQVLKTVKRVPYAYAGYDSYEVDGRILPGYFDPKHPNVDACVILPEVAQ